MGVAYTKDFILDAAMHRYEATFETPEKRTKFRDMISAQYDRQGKDKFRQYASLDAAAIRDFKNKKG